MVEFNAHKEIRKLRILTVLLGIFFVGLLLIIVSVLIKPYSVLCSTILRDVGFVFSPVAMLALLYQHFVEESHKQYVAEKITESIVADVKSHLGQKEFSCVYPSRYAIDFNEFFKRAKRCIAILTTNLSSMEMYVGLLEEKAKQGVSVTVLTLNPFNVFLEMRYKDFSLHTPEEFRQEMIASLRVFCKKATEGRGGEREGKFNVRIYDNAPSIMMFRSDDELILGFILQQGRSRDQIHMKFDCSYDRRGNKCCNDFLTHFENVWKNAKKASEQVIDDIEKK